MHALVTSGEITREEYRAGVQDLAKAARDLYPGRVYGVGLGEDVSVLVRVNDWPWTEFGDMKQIVEKAVRYG
jgi:hypothetical protein